MRKYVHSKIAEKAAKFMKTHADQSYKDALAALESVSVPFESSAGVHAFETDSYRDIVVSDNIGNNIGWLVEWFGQNWTAFNHFINVFENYDGTWPRHSGYKCRWASESILDNIILNYGANRADVKVDYEKSIVFKHFKNYWDGGADALRNHLNKEIQNTEFAPLNVLADFYYSQLILNPQKDLVVGVGEKKISGLEKLGPVLHAIADAVVPHHIHPVLGYFHPQWEATVQRLIQLGSINEYEHEKISILLEQKPCNIECKYTPNEDRPAELNGCFDAGLFVSHIAKKAVRIFADSAGINVESIPQQKNWFWFKRMAGLLWGTRGYGQELYNLALAGTVRAIKMAYEDLNNTGGLDTLTAAGRTTPAMAPRRAIFALDEPAQDKSSETIEKEFKVEVQQRLHAMFGSKELHEKDPLTKDLESFLDVQPEKELTEQELLQAMNKLADQFRQDTVRRGISSRKSVEVTPETLTPQDAAGPGFEKAQTVPDYEMSSHFGLATYRPPTPDELKSEDDLVKYMKIATEYERRAYLVMLAAIKAETEPTRMRAAPDGLEDPFKQAISQLAKYRVPELPE